MVDALTHKGLNVTLVGRRETAFPIVDASLGQLVEKELSRHGVSVVSGVTVQSIQESPSGLAVTGTSGFHKSVDVVLYAVGVKPASELGRAIGIPRGERGAICVNRKMETIIPDVYAAGDCVETWHRLLGRPTYLPLGTTAHKQGRVAGENMTGGNCEFAGSVGKQVVKRKSSSKGETGRPDIEPVQNHSYAAAPQETQESAAHDFAVVHAAYEKATENRWTSSDSEAYAENEIGRVPGARILSVLESVPRGTPAKINSFNYFVKEILTIQDPCNRAWQKKQLEKIVRRIQDNAAGRGGYSAGDLVEAVKLACTRENVLFDNDLLDRVVT